MSSRSVEGRFYLGSFKNKRIDVTARVALFSRRGVYVNVCVESVWYGNRKVAEHVWLKDAMSIFRDVGAGEGSIVSFSGKVYQYADGKYGLKSIRDVFVLYSPPTDEGR